MLTIIIWLEPPLCVVSSWVIRVYTILVWSTISGSSNLDICFYYCLILTLILHLKALFIITITIITIIIIIIITITTTIITITTTIITIITSITITIIIISNNNLDFFVVPIIWTWKQYF